MKWYSNDSQISWACIELMSGREITHINEFNETNGWRLSAIIHNLRHKYKWPISTRYDNNRIAYYQLIKVDKDSLKKPKSYKKKLSAATDNSHKSKIKSD